MPQGKLIDMVGKVVGRLTVIARAPGRKNARWLCRCVCGAHTTVRGITLRFGHTRSCGCLHRERVGDLKRTHGKSRTSEYRIWQQMRNRCTNPKYHSFHRYGGRGIAVCLRWQTFEAFYKDMGPRPSPAHTLERKNNDGPYTKRNCRWATRFEQGQNTSRVVRVGGLSLAEASRRAGLKPWTLANRTRRKRGPNWSLSEALSTPVRRQ